MTTALTTEEFIKKAITIHGDKYDYSLVNYKNSNTKITIICLKHGQFDQVPHSHLNGADCKQCGFIKIHDKKAFSLPEFIEQANVIHKDKYDYSRSIYFNSGTKIEISCYTHGSFWQTPECHLRGNGCPKCGKQKLANLFSLTKEEFVIRCSQIHNNYYDYTLVEYYNSKSKVQIICIKHGIFSQTAAHHLIGKGCPKCSHSISKIERRWLDSLNVKEEYRQITVCINDETFKFDALDPNTNTVYEFYGDYWHGNPKIYDPEDMNLSNKKSFGELYRNTLQKEDRIKKLGFNIITIWEHDFNHKNQ